MKKRDSLRFRFLAFDAGHCIYMKINQSNVGLENG